MSMQSIYKSPAGERAIMAFYDQMLARWPVPYQTLTIDTRHGHTFIIACGDAVAPPLVLLHGAGTNATMWGGDVAEYSLHFRVYAVDLPGEPGRSSPNRPSWAGPAFAEWLGDLLDALQLDQVAIVGISQGGWTALKFATAQPERVEKLVLLTPGGIVRDKVSFFIRAMGLMLLGRWGIQRLNRILFASQSIPAGVEEAVELLMTHFKARTGVLPLFSDEELQRLTMPVLLLTGRQDAMRDGVKMAARLRPLAPQLETTLVPGAGHALLNTTGYILPFLANSKRF